MSAHIIAIDNRLKGIEAEVEAGETTPEDALDRTRALLEQTREEIADVQATAAAENLVARADIIADKLLAQLPEEYNEQDRNVIQSLWTDKMDWDAAVANPDTLSDILTEGFQQTLNLYGTPRGALFTGEEVQELTPEQAELPLTPEEELEGLMNQNWGVTSEKDLGNGRTAVVAEKSDEDFNDALASIIRKANGR